MRPIDTRSNRDRCSARRIRATLPGPEILRWVTLEVSAMLTSVCNCLMPGPCYGNNSYPPAFMGPRPMAPPLTLLTTVEPRRPTSKCCQGADRLPPSQMQVETSPTCALGQLTFSRGQVSTPDCHACLQSAVHSRLWAGSRRVRHLNRKSQNVLHLVALVPPLPAEPVTQLLLAGLLRTPRLGETRKGM